MKILLTGATGFVGRTIARRLLLAGHQLVLTTRSPEHAQKSFPLPVSSFVGWDPNSGPLPSGSLEGVEAVIHLAGESVSERWTEDRKRAIRESRILGTRHLTQSIREEGASVRVALSASAVGYYGDREDEELLEGSTPGQGFLPQVCVDWENEWFSGLPVSARAAALRIGIVLGRGGGALEKLLPIYRSGGGGPVGNGQQWMSWIHIEDLASQFLFALENPAIRGPVNAVGPAPLRNEDFSKILAKFMKVPSVLGAPAVAVKLLFGEMASIVLASQKVLPRAFEAAGFQFRFSTLGQALEELSVADDLLEVDQFIPRPIAEVWPFFSEARNLEALTPPWLSFQVLKTSSPDLGEGTLIDYRLKLHGVPFKWTSRIEEWEPGKRFVDTQVRGPYALWHHTHTFESMGSGTLMRDRVRYRVPAGLLGRVVGGWKVENDVQRIFAFRRLKVRERFGQNG